MDVIISWSLHIMHTHAYTCAKHIYTYRIEQRGRFDSAFRQDHKHPAALRSANKSNKGFDPMFVIGMGWVESGKQAIPKTSGALYGKLITATIYVNVREYRRDRVYIPPSLHERGTDPASN